MAAGPGTDILYMPALHQGYVNYLSERSGEVGILNEVLVRETPRLERDIRAVASGIMVSVVQVVVPDRRVSLVTPDTLESFLDRQVGGRPITMPDEDVSYTFAERHLQYFKVNFEPTFLRWDKRISTLESPVVADREITTDELHKAIMGVAQEEAEDSRDWWRQIGAVIATDGGKTVLLQGHNRPYPTEDYTLETFGDPRSNFDAGQSIEMQKNIHAEASLIAQAARDGVELEGSDLYVTTFPCPICAKSVAEAGIKRVFFIEGYSLLDAADIFKAKGIEVIQVVDKPN
jgi:dCMP deaminase